MVGALGVVEHQPVGQFLVEACEVGEQQVFVVVDEGFLQGALQVRRGRSFWGFWGSLPASNTVGIEGFGKAGFELRAVVREQHLGFCGQQAQGGVECGAGVAAGLAGQG